MDGEVFHMGIYDGGLKETQKKSITLVAYGNLDKNLFYHLRKSLLEFLGSIENDLGFKVTLESVSRINPEIHSKGTEIDIFVDEMSKIPGNIVIGITSIGLYSLSAYPKPRNIFGSGLGEGRGILSNWRFKNKPNINERMGKEIIKVLGLSCGIYNCRDQNCILTYHRHVEDLDNNEGVCENCKKNLVEVIKFMMEEKQKINL